MDYSVTKVEYCRHCGRSTGEVGKLSARGKCLGCARRNMERAPTEMMEGTGHVGAKYLDGVERAAARKRAKV